ncbi:MAG: hypothetical protein JXA30_09270 [Deltaproteobacteria bacterium]|nr:hypothetical protein [Deltaproteobacteria bacterium]
MKIGQPVPAIFFSVIAVFLGCGRIGFEFFSFDTRTDGRGSSNESSDAAIDAGDSRDGAAIDSGDGLIDSQVDATGPTPAVDSTISSRDAQNEISSIDSATDASEDAAVDSAIDASEDAPPDAAVPDSSDGAQGTDSSATETGPTTCGGTVVFGRCWYLTEVTISCNQHCADHGGYDSETPQYVGTPSEGGSLDECSQILTALGYSQTVAEGTNIHGYGCHVWSSDAWWLRSPEFDPAFSGAPARIACACNQ